jgi:hypothetical protein
MARPGRRVTALLIAFSVQCQAATREIAAAVTVGLVAATFIVVWSSVVWVETETTVTRAHAAAAPITRNKVGEKNDYHQLRTRDLGS